MPIPAVAYPIIAAGVSGLFSLFSSKVASNAAKDAGTLSKDANERALAYEMEQSKRSEAYQRERDAYNDRRDGQSDAYRDERDRVSDNRMAPYAQAGGMAVTTLGGLLSPGSKVEGDMVYSRNAPGGQTLGSIYQATQRPKATAPATSAPPTTPTAPETPGAAPGGTERPEQTVLMTAPDGESGEVPESQVQTLLGKGFRMGGTGQTKPNSMGGMLKGQVAY